MLGGAIRVEADTIVGFGELQLALVELRKRQPARVAVIENAELRARDSRYSPRAMISRMISLVPA
jgi:hypothetical protein